MNWPFSKRWDGKERRVKQDSTFHTRRVSDRRVQQPSDENTSSSLLGTSGSFNSDSGLVMGGIGASLAESQPVQDFQGFGGGESGGGGAGGNWDVPSVPDPAPSCDTSSSLDSGSSSCDTGSSSSSDF